MLDKNYCDMVSDAVKQKKREADDFIKKYIDPIADIGNPEDLIGKPYSMWTPQDKETLRQVYVYSPQTLEEFITKHEVDRVWELQKMNRKLGV